MSVLTVAGQKGGSGKTNLVRNLAIHFAVENAGIPRLKTPVFERTAFKRASFTRVAPVFDEPGGGAAENIKAVYAEVRDALAETVAKGREL